MEWSRVSFCARCIGAEPKETLALSRCTGEISAPALSATLSDRYYRISTCTYRWFTRPENRLSLTLHNLSLFLFFLFFKWKLCSNNVYESLLTCTEDNLFSVCHNRLSLDLFSCYVLSIKSYLVSFVYLLFIINYISFSFLSSHYL